MGELPLRWQKETQLNVFELKFPNRHIAHEHENV